MQRWYGRMVGGAAPEAGGSSTSACARRALRSLGSVAGAMMSPPTRTSLRFSDSSNIAGIDRCVPRSGRRIAPGPSDTSGRSAERAAAPWTCGRPRQAPRDSFAPAHKAHRARPSSPRSDRRLLVSERERSRERTAERDRPTLRAQGAALAQRARAGARATSSGLEVVALRISSGGDPDPGVIARSPMCERCGPRESSRACVGANSPTWDRPRGRICFSATVARGHRRSTITREIGRFSSSGVTLCLTTISALPRASSRRALDRRRETRALRAARVSSTDSLLSRKRPESSRTARLIAPKTAVLRREHAEHLSRQ